MKLVVHDYGGYGFIVQLSRELARRGHEVLHLYSDNLTTTPQGRVQKAEDDPVGFTPIGIDIGRKIDKSQKLKLLLENDPAHAAKCMEVIESFQPDLIISANTSMGINDKFLDYAWETECQFVCWVQDIFWPVAQQGYGKVPVAGPLGVQIIKGWEEQMWKRSDAIVLITEDFRSLLPLVDVPVHVIHNWAPLEDVPVREKVNDWSLKHGLSETVNLMYSGTLGMKHNPELLVKLADRVRDRENVRVVVNSAGAGMDYLARRKEELGLDHLILQGFQLVDELPDVFGAADVMLAVLEPDAAAYSVPSKILSYLCAGRAIAFSVDAENLSARLVKKHDAGFVVSPKDDEGFVLGVVELLDNEARRVQLGKNAREYAESAFDIGFIADRFERVMDSSMRLIVPQ